jgi:hypothetical protein
LIDQRRHTGTSETEISSNGLCRKVRRPLAELFRNI